MEDDTSVESGYHLPDYDKYESPDAWRKLVTAAERCGFDAVYFGDHIAFPTKLDGFAADIPAWVDPSHPRLETFQALTYLASVTDEIRVGPNICIAPLRHPVLLTKQVLSLTELYPGRVEFGVGVGWLSAEYALLEIPFDERGSRTDEFLDFFTEALESVS